MRIKKLFGFAYKLILARLINTLFNQFYSIAIGRIYDPAQLGLYNRAKSFEEMSSNNIANLVQRVSMPMLCAEKENILGMQSLLLKYIKNTAFIVYPILFGLFALAYPIIDVLLTDKWLEAAWILRVLCPVGLLYVITTFNLNIFNATGRTDWALKSEMFKKVIFIIVIIISIQISFEVLIFNQILISMIEVILNLYYTKKQIQLPIIKQFSNLLSITMISLVMMLSILFVNIFIDSSFLQLVVGCSVGIIVYITLALIFNILNLRNEIYNKIKTNHKINI